FQKHWNLDPIRLLGITVQDVEEKKNIAHQLDLFTYEKEAEKEKLYEAIDTLSRKYGKDTFTHLHDQVAEGQLRTSFQKDFLNDYKQ
ncbi:MAG TPA: DNA polymerase IV, partial [Virgibacillus sp.]|nr:DNA polymerase IV [Virgibacillus sp.]